MKKLHRSPAWTKRKVSPGEEAPTTEERKARKSDRIEALRYWGIVLLIVGMSIWTWQLTASLKSDNTHIRTTATQAALVARELKAETETRSTNRTADLISSCRRGSDKSAATVNLYWIDYQAEILLSTHHATQVPNSVPLVLARAYYTAARENAKTIDYRDLNLLQISTPLGSEQIPREWVILDHYNCNEAFR